MGLGGIEDLIRKLDFMRDTFQEIQDCHENYEKVYHSGVQNMLEELVNFNQNYTKIHEVLVDKIE